PRWLQPRHCSAGDVAPVAWFRSTRSAPPRPTSRTFNRSERRGAGLVPAPLASLSVRERVRDHFISVGLSRLRRLLRRRLPEQEWADLIVPSLKCGPVVGPQLAGRGRR